MGLKNDTPNGEAKSGADRNKRKHTSSKTTEEMTTQDENGDLLKWKKTCKETTSQLSLEITVTKTKPGAGGAKSNFADVGFQPRMSSTPATYGDYDYCKAYNNPGQNNGYGSFVQPIPGIYSQINNQPFQHYNMSQNQFYHPMTHMPVSHCYAYYNGHHYMRYH